MALKQNQEIIDLDIDEDCNDVLQGNKNVKGATGMFSGPIKAEQVSMHSGQTVKKVDSNNKGKDVSVGTVKKDSMGLGHCSNSFIDLDDYDLEDDNYSMATQLQSQFDLDNYALEDDHIMALKLQSQFDNMADIPTGLHANNSSKKNSSFNGSSSSIGKDIDYEDVLGRYESDFSDDYDGSSSSMGKDVDDGDVLRSYESDFSVDDYSTPNPRTDQPPKNPANRMNDGKRILGEKLSATKDWDTLSKRNWGFYERFKAPLMMNQNGGSSMAASYNNRSQKRVVSLSPVRLKLRNSIPRKRISARERSPKIERSRKRIKMPKRERIPRSPRERNPRRRNMDFVRTPRQRSHRVSGGSWSGSRTTSYNASVSKMPRSTVKAEKY